MNERKSKKATIFYHSTCKSTYQYQAHPTDNNEWHKKRNHSHAAYNELCCYVKEQIINKKSCVSLKFAEEMYLQYLLESYGDAELHENIFSAARIGERLLKTFTKKLKIVNVPGQGKMLAAIQVNVAIDMTEYRNNEIIQRAAFLLRRKILDIKPNKIEPPINSQKIIDGECDIPDELNKFYTILLCAHNYRDRKSDKTQLLIKSLASDAIYNVTRGKVIPSKTVTLACSLKSLTTSHKVITILNRYGHVVSDDIIRNLETEAAYEIMKNSKVCPSEVIAKKNLGTLCAFDNFDRHVDSIMGKITMNDTNGIVVQNIDDTPDSIHTPEDMVTDSETG